MPYGPEYSDVLAKNGPWEYCGGSGGPVPYNPSRGSRGCRGIGIGGCAAENPYLPWGAGGLGLVAVRLRSPIYTGAGGAGGLGLAAGRLGSPIYHGEQGEKTPTQQQIIIPLLPGVTRGSQPQSHPVVNPNPPNPRGKLGDLSRSTTKQQILIPLLPR